MMDKENITRLRADLERWYEGECSGEEELRLLRRLESASPLPDDMQAGLRLLRALRASAEAQLQDIGVPGDLTKKIRLAVGREAAKERRVRSSRWKAAAWLSAIAACAAAIIVVYSVLTTAPGGDMGNSATPYAAMTDTAETMRDCRSTSQTAHLATEKGETSRKVAAAADARKPHGAPTPTREMARGYAGTAKTASARNNADCLTDEQMRILSAGLYSVRHEMQNTTRENAAEFSASTRSASSAMRNTASEVKNVKCEIENINDDIKISL